MILDDDSRLNQIEKWFLSEGLPLQVARKLNKVYEVYHYENNHGIYDEFNFKGSFKYKDNDGWDLGFPVKK